MEVDLLEHVFALFWSTEMQFILYPIVPSHVLSDLFECIWVLIYNFFNADKLFLWVVCQTSELDAVSLGRYSDFRFSMERQNETKKQLKGLDKHL